jgi:hypothetical protein
MTGKKVNYYLTLKVPILFCWIFYAAPLAAWTLLNVILLPNLSFGFWVYVGAAGASFLLRYHFKMYLNELKSIRTFMLLMSDA